MFLVSDNFTQRRKKILSFVTDADAPIAVLLAAANFEWTIGRAIIALGNSPNGVLRPRVEKCSGLERYKDLWKDEVSVGRSIGRLPEVVTDWSGFMKAFDLRHLLIHGRESCSKSYAEPKVVKILDAATQVFDVCGAHGINLNEKLKVRRLPRIR